MFSETAFRNRNKSCHPLVHSIYFNSQFPKLDLMHVIDHRGCAGAIAGSVLTDLVRRERRLGNNQEERLDNINVKLKTWYSGHLVSSTIASIEIQNITQADGWAMLHGPLIKAANTRNLMPFIEALCLEYYDRDDEFCNSVVTAVTRLNCVFGILYDAEI